MNSPTGSPFDVSANPCWGGVCAGRLPPSPPVLPSPLGSPEGLPFASAPPMGDAVAVAARWSSFTSMLKAPEPGADLFDFHAQYSVAQDGGASTGSGLPSDADITKNRWFFTIPLASRSDVCRNSFVPSGDHAS